MTKLSVRRGWMLKKNEQGAWQRRYCCLVPHTFLYYFESKDSEVGCVFAVTGGGGYAGVFSVHPCLVHTVHVGSTCHCFVSEGCA